MLKERYVSFETAKLLKEAGFDEETEHKIWYVVKKFATGTPWNSCVYEPGEKTREYSKENCISMPTLQMATDWLRQQHKLHVDVGYDDLDWFWNILTISEDVPIADRPKQLKCGTACHDSFEDACEDGLKYCLKELIGR